MLGGGHVPLGDRRPHGGGRRPAVGQRQGTAAAEPVVAGALQIAGYARPHQGDDGAVAVAGVDAGAARLHQVAAQAGAVQQPVQLELGLGVKPSGRARPLGRQQPVGAHHLPGRPLPHQEVVAVGVEGVGVQARFGARQAGAQLPGEDLVPQALRGPYVRLVPGEGDGVAVAAGRGGRRWGRCGGRCGCGGLGGDTGKGGEGGGHGYGWHGGSGHGGSSWSGRRRITGPAVRRDRLSPFLRRAGWTARVRSGERGCAPVEHTPPARTGR